MTTATLTKPFFHATLSIPTSTNAARGVHDGRLISSKALRQFKRDAHMTLIAQELSMSKEERTRYRYVKDLVFDASKLPGDDKIPLKIEITAYLETLWKRDVSNLIKTLEDALFEYMGLNDNLVVDIHIRKEVDRRNPRCEVNVSVFEE